MCGRVIPLRTPYFGRRWLALSLWKRMNPSVHARLSPRSDKSESGNKTTGEEMLLTKKRGEKRKVEKKGGEKEKTKASQSEPLNQRRARVVLNS
jgi:hypothetical protein